TLLVPSDAGWIDEPVAPAPPPWPRASTPASATPTGPDAVIALATVDPAVGAGHLPRWANSAVVFVTPGRSNAQHISGTAELLRAASVSVTSAVLVNTDPGDDSVGLVDAEQPAAERPVGRPLGPQPSNLR